MSRKSPNFVALLWREQFNLEQKMPLHISQGPFEELKSSFPWAESNKKWLNYKTFLMQF
jgi:hypothetical protein